MKTFTKAIAIVLFSLPLLAHAAGKSANAAMQVTFEVKDSCSVQSSAAATAAVAGKTAATPAVACQLNTPYQLARNDAASPAAANAANSSATQPNALRQQSGAGEWTITF